LDKVKILILSEKNFYKKRLSIYVTLLPQHNAKPHQRTEIVFPLLGYNRIQRPWCFKNEKSKHRFTRPSDR